MGILQKAEHNTVINEWKKGKSSFEQIRKAPHRQEVGRMKESRKQSGTDFADIY
jgi:hypothetical protein